MITRIEIDGFKTFKDFSLDLLPFQVIAGPNGAGKSNLFDFFRFVSRLLDGERGSLYPIPNAMQGIRGENEEILTILDGEKTVDEFKICHRNAG